MNRTDGMERRGTAAVVGMFDGVHRGHRHLLGELAALAAARGLRPLAVTFTDHPLTCIRPGDAPRLLSLPDEKRAMIESLGIETAMLDFTPQLRNMSASEFLAMLRRRFGTESMLLGFNNRFGHDAPAELGDYVALAREEGITLEGGTEFGLPDGGGVSSSAVRRALAAGDAELAADMLGRMYTLAGIVEGGRQLGRTIGFPTANIAPESARKLVPAPGVYAAVASLPGGEELPAMVNIGSNPTVGGDAGRQTMEAHIIGFDGNLYGQMVRLGFAARLRDERRFPSVEALAAQLRADREAVLGMGVTAPGNVSTWV